MTSEPILPVAELPVVVSAGEALTDLVRTGGRSWVAHPGGAGWNVARACAALGVRSAFAGAVGQDVFGDDLAHETEAAGLDGRFLQRRPEPTLMAVVYRTDPPAYSFMGENSADLHFGPDALPVGWQDAVKWVHLGGISLARPPLAGRLVRLAREARAAGAKVSFDPNARVTHRDPAYRAVMEEVLTLADLVKFSDEDLRFFFPTLTEEEVLLWLRERGTTAPVVVTRGGDGATLYTTRDRTDVPAVRVEVVDTVGAGDAFVAGLLYGAVQAGAEPDWAAHVAFAARVAAAACTRAGAYAPTVRDVEAIPPTTAAAGTGRP